jgi:hypothetical protein
VALKVNLLSFKVNFATNIKDPFMFDIFEIIDGEDANKFTLKGNELTFKATAFKARNNATYRVTLSGLLVTVTTRVCSSVAKRGAPKSNTLVALMLIR